MAAVIRDIRSLSSLPAAVYVDTSVLLAAYVAGGGSGDMRDLACAAFVKAASTSTRCDAWTSLLAVQEACWLPLRRELAAQKPAGAKDLREFRMSFPAAYSTAYASARRTVGAMMAFLKGSGIGVRARRAPSTEGGRAERAACFLVKQMMQRYELEMADLFHIAFAKLDGTSAIATLDSGYQAVDGLEVYTVP